jgi:hypothetical protein
MNKKLPTWCELVPFERHKLLGELIDAMIYEGRAVDEVQNLLRKFKLQGLVKNKLLINPTDESIN